MGDHRSDRCACNTMTEAEPQNSFIDAANWHLASFNSNVVATDEPIARVIQQNNGLAFQNESNEKVLFEFSHPMHLPKNDIGASISLSGSIINGTGNARANNTDLPLNGKAFIPCSPDDNIIITFECSANAEVSLSKLELNWETRPVDLSKECSNIPRVLVVVPDYPTEANLYMAAFAHSRNRRYLQKGLDVQVAVIRPDEVTQMVYRIDGVSVYVGSSWNLRELIQRKQYQVIVVHFVDHMHYEIFDSYITNEHLIFICHGPETILPFLRNSIRPYFSQPVENLPYDSETLSTLRRYATKENVEWVFVSQWLMGKSEEIVGVQFTNKHIIHNVVDENLFPYQEKSDEDRTRILLLRRFENNQNHSVDIAVEAIRALSRRSFFNDLSFDIVGDGTLFDILTAPLADFPNVHIQRTFVPNPEISRLHSGHGIFLAPSRHDTQGVSSCEAASSGLVVVGSDIACSRYFFDSEANHTLAEPEDPEALADIIERLYYSPKEFHDISKRMSQRMGEICCTTETTDREIALIKSALHDPDDPLDAIPQITRSQDPLLTILVPAYNVSDYLHRCLFSLLNHRNADKLEIIVIDDGSSDNTLATAEVFEDRSPDIVRVFSQSNRGYGSAVNRGLQEARGKYFRIVDGDDWVVSDGLAALIDLLEHESADLVLTSGKHEFTYNESPTPIMDYPMLQEGRLYNFEDLTYPHYGFLTYGPIVSTSTYKTSCLLDGDFTLTERSPFVDNEFNAFAICCVDSVRFVGIDIYRYLIGREGQSSSLRGWREGHGHYRNVLFSVIEKTLLSNRFSTRKKDYVAKHIVAPLFNNMLVIYDSLHLWDKIPSLIQELGEYSCLLDICKQYVEDYYPATLPILKYYPLRLNEQGAKQPQLYGYTGNCAPCTTATSTPTSEICSNTPQKRGNIRMLIRSMTPPPLLRYYQKRKRSIKSKR